MTRRTPNPSRTTRQRRLERPTKRIARLPTVSAITALGFTCFRLVRAGETALVAIHVRESRNAMGAFVFASGVR